MTRRMLDAFRCHRTTALAGAVLVLVALLPGCSSGNLGAGDAARVLSGSGLLVAEDGDWGPVAVDAVLRDGARLRTGEDEVRLEFRGGEVWLAPGSAAIVSIERVDLIRGDVLVASGGSLGVRWAEVDAHGAGLYRLTPGFAPRLAVYRGEATLERPGEELLVPGLRQADLSVRRLAPEAVPLDYRSDDAWDRLLLAQAIAFDAEVARFARGVEREFGADPREAAFYERFTAIEGAAIPVLAQTTRVTADGRYGPPSDALVTLFVAQAAAESGLAVRDVTRDIARLRRLGARWGLVATELGISSGDFLAAADMSPVGSLAEARELLESLPSVAVAEPADVAPGSGGGAAPAATGDSSTPPQQPRPRPHPEQQPPPQPGPAPGPAPAPLPVDDGKLLIPPAPPPSDRPPAAGPVESLIGGGAQLVTDVVEGLIGALP